MSRTAADVTPEEQAAYVATLRRREARLQARLAEREERAWQLAREAAAMLRECYGATRVVVFGSLARGHFHLHSDIDLAAWGIAGAEVYGAISDALSHSRDIEINLVPMPTSSEALPASIDRDGVELT